MQHRMAGIFALLFAASAVFLTCCKDESSSGGEKSCSVGAESCACTADGKCNSGLECVDNKCLAPVEETDDDTGDGDTGPERDTNPTTSDIAVVNEGGGKLCAEGVVVGPVEDNADEWSSHWGAGFGINFCQSESNADKLPLGECSRVDPRLVGFRLTVTGELPSELRIQYEDDVSDDDNGYIVAAELDEPADYLFEDIEVLYLAEADRPDLDPAHFTSIQFQIASHVGEIEEFNFCIENIEVILAEEDPDAGVPDGGVDEDTGEPSTDPACADPTSLKIIPAESSWVAGCSNAARIQGDMYSYSD